MSDAIKAGAEAGAKARRGVTAKTNDTDHEVARAVLDAATADVEAMARVVFERPGLDGSAASWVEADPAVRQSFMDDAQALRDWMLGGEDR